MSIRVMEKLLSNIEEIGRDIIGPKGDDLCLAPLMSSVYVFIQELEYNSSHGSFEQYSVMSICPSLKNVFEFARQNILNVCYGSVKCFKATVENKGPVGKSSPFTS